MEHEVWIPALHRDLTNGAEIVKISGETVGELIANLDAQFPGMAARLLDNGRVRPYISVAINGTISSAWAAPEIARAERSSLRSRFGRRMRLGR